MNAIGEHYAGDDDDCSYHRQHKLTLLISWGGWALRPLTSPHRCARPGSPSGRRSLRLGRGGGEDRAGRGRAEPETECRRAGSFAMKGFKMLLSSV